MKVTNEKEKAVVVKETNIIFFTYKIIKLFKL